MSAIYFWKGTKRKDLRSLWFATFKLLKRTSSQQTSSIRWIKRKLQGNCCYNVRLPTVFDLSVHGLQIRHHCSVPALWWSGIYISILSCNHLALTKRYFHWLPYHDGDWLCPNNVKGGRWGPVMDEWIVSGAGRLGLHRVKLGEKKKTLK